MKIVAVFGGEFAWFLWGFQGHMRYLALQQNDEVIIISRPEYEYLVEDFVTEFIPFDFGSTETSGYNVKNANSHKHILDNLAYDRLIDENWHIGWDYDHIDGSIKLKPDSVFLDQVIIPYGSKNTEWSFDILVHARSTKKWKTDNRNWTLGKWNDLVSRFDGLKIGCIGSYGGASPVAGTHDLRGLPLDTLCDIMASSKVLVSGSSGPCHLAALTRTPHVVWSPPHNRARYEYSWNWFKTPVQFFSDKDWQPDVEDILPLIKEFLNDD